MPNQQISATRCQANRTIIAEKVLFLPFLNLTFSPFLMQTMPMHEKKQQRSCTVSRIIFPSSIDKIQSVQPQRVIKKGPFILEFISNEENIFQRKNTTSLFFSFFFCPYTDIWQHAVSISILFLRLVSKAIFTQQLILSLLSAVTVNALSNSGTVWICEARLSDSPFKALSLWIQRTQKALHMLLAYHCHFYQEHMGLRKPTRWIYANVSIVITPRGTS